MNLFKVQLLFTFFILCVSSALSQDTINDSLVRSEFQSKVDSMIINLNMTDSVESQFLEIYTEYGIYMKDAYENRITWMGLYRQYKYAKSKRDNLMSEILNNEQFVYFVKRQKEIEQEARNNSK